MNYNIWEWIVVLDTDEPLIDLLTNDPDMARPGVFVTPLYAVCGHQCPEAIQDRPLGA